MAELTTEKEGVNERHSVEGPPGIEFIKRSRPGRSLGIFASSFNPPTIAHIELIHRAVASFSLNEILALAGKSNADKVNYDCPLEDRLSMLELTFANDPAISIGVSSHAFYVDMIEALERCYPDETDLHFIIGFDTFERVLDHADRYTEKYYRTFNGRTEALRYLFAHSSLIVAGRSGTGFPEVNRLIASDRAVPADRVRYLEFPSDLGDVSATEVRKRRREREAINDLVPAAVETYIQEHSLYKS